MSAAIMYQFSNNVFCNCILLLPTVYICYGCAVLYMHEMNKNVFKNKEGYFASINETTIFS